MPMHSKHSIQKLQKHPAGTARSPAEAIPGTDVTTEEERMYGLHGPHARVRSDHVRIAVDDFQDHFLKEIKATLGKR